MYNLNVADDETLKLSKATDSIIKGVESQADYELQYSRMQMAGRSASMDNQVG